MISDVSDIIIVVIVVGTISAAAIAVWVHHVERKGPWL